MENKIEEFMRTESASTECMFADRESTPREFANVVTKPYAYGK